MWLLTKKQNELNAVVYGVSSLRSAFFVLMMYTEPGALDDDHAEEEERIRR